MVKLSNNLYIFILIYYTTVWIVMYNICVYNLYMHEKINIIVITHCMKYLLTFII